MDEGRLTHHTLLHDTAGDRYLLILELLEIIPDLLAVLLLIELRNLERILSGSLQLCKLLTARTNDMVRILYRRLVLLVFLILCHSFSLLLITMQTTGASSPAVCRIYHYIT